MVKKAEITQVQFYLSAEGRIKFTPQKNLPPYGATASFTPHFDTLDGRSLSRRWINFQIGTDLVMLDGMEYSIGSDVVQVIRTFEKPWTFTLQGPSMDEAEAQLRELFDREMDAHLAMLKVKGAHRTVNLGSVIASNIIDVRRIRSRG